MSEIYKSLEEIINGLWLETTDKTEACRRMREVLSGYRIVSPGALDKVTLEAAKKANCDGCAQEIPLNKCGFHQNGTVTTPCHSAAIRALGGGEG